MSNPDEPRKASPDQPDPHQKDAVSPPPQDTKRKQPPPADPPEDTEEDEEHPPEESPWHRVIGALIAIIIVVVAVVLTLLVWDIKEHHPRTDDAFLRTNVVPVAPRVRGQLVEVYVHDNQMVNEGDPLFQIDPEDYELMLAQARSSLAALDEQIEVARRQDLNLQFQIKAAIANVESSKFQLKQANDTLHRMEPLLPKAYAAADDVDKARTSRDVASSNLAMSQQKLDEARTTISTLGSLLAQRPGLEAQVKQAELNLSYCRVVAAVPGRVINVNISKGAYVNAGTPVFSMTDARHWYVIAELREGELRHAPPGSEVDLYLLAEPHRVYRGHIRSLGGGVMPSESESDTPGQLPSVPRELDWVHIAQRFPVRIEVDQPDQDVFRMGASAVVTVHPNGDSSQRGGWRW